jgi:hypothetical protein
MVALHTVWYNFIEMHKTLRMTPAMAAGLSYRLHDVGDIVAMIVATPPAAAKRGPYQEAGGLMKQRGGN